MIKRTGSSIYTAISVLLCALPCGARRADAAPIPVNRTELIDNYQKEIGAYRAASRKLRITGTLTEGFSSPAERNRVTMLIDGERQLLRLQQMDQRAGQAPDGELVLVRTPYRSFQVRKKNQKRDHMLEYLGENSKPVNKYFKYYCESYICSPWTIYGMPIDEMIKDPKFIISRVESSGEGPARSTKLSFDYRPADRGGQHLAGWWTLGHDEGWPVQEYELNGIMDGLKIRGKVIYGDKEGGYRRPKTVIVRYDGPATSQESRFEVDEYRIADIPSGEFSLARFGLGGLEPSSGSGLTVSPGAIFFSMGSLFAVASIYLKLKQERVKAAGYHI